ncbi:ChaN family lipoprotein [Pseudoroseomonas cervicalis]|uniref:ChaN family lipoprotein n=1 Tax=Teichococcus cervicalis TaxID=204525 RepID=UPI0035E6395D
MRDPTPPRARWLDPATGALLETGPLLRPLAQRDVVLLGESHDVAEIHRWQLQVATCLHLLRPDMALGFEMFPRRVQPVLDRWVAGAFSTAAFLEAVAWDKVWGFDAALYLPLLHFCRQQAVPMLALNCERPLVTRIGRDGWEAVPEAERDGMTPAAPARPGHRAQLGRLTGRGEAAISDRFLRAQQVWDRAFACNIAAYRAAVVARGRPAPLVVGIIGRGHLEHGHGTPWQLETLGIADTAVLLPSEAETLDPAAVAGIGTALFRLDRPDEAAGQAPQDAAAA